jgi:hypothetical protein
MTREDVLKAFAEADAKIAAERAERSRPKPSAAEKSKERWNEDTQPSEVIYSHAAKSVDAAARRRAREREEIEQTNTPQARYQAELDRWWQSMRNAQQDERPWQRIHYVGGFLVGGDGDYSPIALHERYTYGRD